MDALTHEVNMLISIISLVISICISLVFGHAAMYNIKFLMRIEKRFDTSLLIILTTVEIVTAVAYAYVSLSFLTPNPVMTGFFGQLILRPVVFLLGSSLASLSRLRYKLITTEGGEFLWIPRKRQS